MVAGAQQMNSSLKAKADCSHPQGLRRALQMGKSMKTASTQQTDSSSRAVLQWMVK